MNGLNFYNHKWNSDLVGTEDTVLVPGVKKISIFYVPEVNNPVVDSSALKKQLTSADTLKAVPGSVLANKIPDDGKKAKSKFPIALLILLVAVLGLVGWFTYGVLQRRRIQGKIDNDEL
jgi:hypothetical protein